MRMTSQRVLDLIIGTLLLFFTQPRLSSAQKPLLTPITKDQSTSLYSISLFLKTPLQPTNLHLDLGAPYFWVDCTRRYKSSSYHHLLSNSSLCLSLDTRVTGQCVKKPGPGCSNDSCEAFPENSVTRQSVIGDILLDTLALSTTDGRKPGPLALLTEFVFSCANTKLLRGLASGVTGLAALGRFNYSLPAQLSRAFSSPAVFALCLPSSPSARGVAFFNSAGPYYFSPGVDVSASLIYTPLLLNPFDTTLISYVRPSADYFIGLTSIQVNGKPVPLNQTLLRINPADGFGGTKISTSTPYAVLQTSILEAVTKAFVAEAGGLKLTAAIKPFKVCFAAQSVPVRQGGPAVPTIDLVLQYENKKYWRIFGSNSMVRIRSNKEDAWCLGFVDGGAQPKTSVVIGGLQMQDNLLQFDLAQGKLGFSSSLLIQGTSCVNFNFELA